MQKESIQTLSFPSGIECIEFFQCPLCRRVSFDLYEIKSLNDDYACHTYCSSCQEEVQSVDSFERCLNCRENLDCLAGGDFASLIAVTSVSYTKKLDSQRTRGTWERSAKKIKREIEKSLGIRSSKKC
jgi:hypothetical protein